jgi:hypothetical protein
VGLFRQGVGAWGLVLIKVAHAVCVLNQRRPSGRASSTHTHEGVGHPPPPPNSAGYRRPQSGQQNKLTNAPPPFPCRDPDAKMYSMQVVFKALFVILTLVLFCRGMRTCVSATLTNYPFFLSFLHCYFAGTLMPRCTACRWSSRRPVSSSHQGEGACSPACRHPRP